MAIAIENPLTTKHRYIRKHIITGIIDTAVNKIQPNICSANGIEPYEFVVVVVVEITFLRFGFDRKNTHSHLIARRRKKNTRKR